MKSNVSFLTEEISDFCFSLNDDKIIQSIDSTETYPYRRNKDLVYKKEEIDNMIKQHKNI